MSCQPQSSRWDTTNTPSQHSPQSSPEPPSRPTKNTNREKRRRERDSSYVHNSSSDDSDYTPPAQRKKTAEKKPNRRRRQRLKRVLVKGNDNIVLCGNENVAVRGAIVTRPTAEDEDAYYSCPEIPDNLVNPIIDVSNVEPSTIPIFLAPPAEYTQAVELVKSKQQPSHLHSEKVEFYYDYVKSALRQIGFVGKKLICPEWTRELKEGWYDSSLWSHIIDALCADSQYVTVMRKEIHIIPRIRDASKSDKFDGVFRCMATERFDLGVIEVGIMSATPNSDPKPDVDRAKIIRGMERLLAEARRHKEDLKLQVIGILCSGFHITLFRMWHNGVACVVAKEKYRIRPDHDHSRVAQNLEVFTALVRSLQILKQTAAILLPEFEDFVPAPDGQE